MANYNARTSGAFSLATHSGEKVVVSEYNGIMYLGVASFDRTSGLRLPGGFNFHPDELDMFSIQMVNNINCCTQNEHVVYRPPQSPLQALPPQVPASPHTPMASPQQGPMIPDGPASPDVLPAGASATHYSDEFGVSPGLIIKGNKIRMCGEFRPP